MNRVELQERRKAIATRIIILPQRSMKNTVQYLIWTISFICQMSQSHSAAIFRAGHGLDMRHHNYAAMVDYMHRINKECPNITRLYSIGKSTEKRELLVMEITDNPGKHELLEPEFKYVGNMHGNEVVGREMLLYLLDDMCMKFKENKMKANPVNQEVVDLIKSTRIHIMPSMNPDGYEKGTEGDCFTTRGRPNANGFDLNRNFPDQFFNRHEEEQPETKAIIEWIRGNPFTLSANLHGGSLVANYPFDDDKAMIEEYSKSPDDELFKHLAYTYSKNHPTMHLGLPPCKGESERFPDGITNGAKWYNVAGGMQDYNYLHSNCLEITVEMACCKFPMASQLSELWKEHKKPLYEFMKMTHMGIKGVVKKSDGTAVQGAIIRVGGINHDIHSTAYGDYFRLLQPGKYKVTCVVGKLSLTTDVNVPAMGVVQVDFIIHDKSITAQSSRPMTRSEIEHSSVKGMVTGGSDSGESSTKMDSFDKSLENFRQRKSKRSDNVVAAVVIVTIGCLVCLLAGIVLYRKVKDLKVVKEGYGYEKVDPDFNEADEAAEGSTEH